MRRNFDDFREAMRKELQSLNSPEIQEVRSVFETELSELLRKGIISYGPEYKLGDKELEYYVHNIFKAMRFQVEEAHKSKWDGIVRPFEGLELENPLVLEIKSSSKASGPSIAELRELDDWVFELSGEEFARKEGLGGGCDPLAVSSYGMVTERHTHPSPHKGVMVFNGPREKKFQERQEKDILVSDQKDFVFKRNICIISLECLISWYDEYRRNNSVNSNFWEIIHSTVGVLPLYNTP